MSPVPVLLVLYTNDAAEIRYSDGSSLELSPCGSTMIYHSPTPRNQHPIQGSSKCQKRTRFVTSEHRQKVLQALDFRNRFADRPYLCKELIQKEDIVALYANVSEVSWPKTSESAQIEILHDRSRKINSLDEFASIVMSPHGQDMTVCYLSRLSEDRGPRKRNLSGASTMTSQSRNQGASLKSSVVSTVSNNACKTSEEMNLPCEAVVHPYFQQTKPQCAISSLVHEEREREHQFEQNKNEDQQTNTSALQPKNFTVEGSHEIDSLRDANNSNIVSDEVSCRPLVSGLAIVPVQQAVHVLDGSYNGSFAKKSEDSSKPFGTSFSTSHDISSISRCSTPDGLRTMVDTDATLSTETGEEYDRATVKVYKQKHSSPAQGESFEHQLSQRGITPGCGAKAEDACLSGSFLGNEYVKSHNSSSEGDSLGERTLTEGGNDCAVKKTLNLDESSSELKLEPENGEVIQSLLPKQMALQVLVHCLSPRGTSAQHTTTQSTQQSAVSCHTSTPLQQTGLNHSTQHTKSHQEYPMYTKQTSSPPQCVLTSSSNQCEDSRNLASPHTALHSTKIPISTSTSNFSHPTTNMPIHTNTLTHTNSNTSVRTNTSSASSTLTYDEEEETSCRHQYVWTTRHISRNDCPSAWTHPLKLLLDRGAEVPSEVQKQRKGEKKNIKTPLPTPTFLTCPFQRNHKWKQDGETQHAEKQDLSVVTEFNHGRIKVIITEGIVYRLVHQGELSLVEIHPGDGTMLVSHGNKAQFFTHFVPAGDKLEERTYSLKAAGYIRELSHIDKLIKRANRLFTMSSQWEKRGMKEERPCWKMEVVAIVEPLSSSLLEETQVDGVGKFSAFTNGRVRIVFQDRTALDAVADFSTRLKHCLAHSSEPQAALPIPTSQHKGLSSCRLLLPNGEYIHPDGRDPGVYKKYISSAEEWVEWVNCSPEQRKIFYSQHHLPSILKQAAQLELKKIFCFNYMLEMTQELQDNILNKDNSKGIEPSSSSSLEKKSLHPQLQHYGEKQTLQSSHCPVATTSKTTQHYTGNVARPSRSELSSGWQHTPHDHPTVIHGAKTGHPSRSYAEVQSLDSVRDALALTASMINDIDDFLQKKDSF